MGGKGTGERWRGRPDERAVGCRGKDAGLHSHTLSGVTAKLLAVTSALL